MGIKLRRTTGVLTAVVAGAMVLGLSTTASAAPVSKVVHSTGPDASVTCSLTISGYNITTGKVVGTLSASIRPSTPGGLVRNATSQVYCETFGDGFTFSGFDYATKTANAPVVTVSKTVRLDYDSSYEVCATGAVILRNGTTTYTAFNCTP